MNGDPWEQFRIKRPAPPDVNADPGMAITPPELARGGYLPHDPQAPAFRNISGQASDIDPWAEFRVKEVPHDHPSNYFSEGLSQVKTGLGEAWEGAKETGSQIYEGYRAGGGVPKSLAGKAIAPLYGLGGAAIAAMGTPAAEALGNVALSHPGGLWPGLSGQTSPPLPAAKNVPSPLLESDVGKLAEQSVLPLGAPGRGAVQSGARQAAPTLEPDIRAIVAKNYGPEAVRIAEKASPPGMTRFYHGGQMPGEGESRWLTPDLEYAKGYAQKSGAPVSYVDIPDTHPLLKKSFDDTGTSFKAPFVPFEAPPEISRGLKSLGAAAAPPTRPPAVAPTSGEKLQSLIMQQYGLGRREANKVSADFEQHYRAVNKSSVGEIWNLVDAAQGQAPANTVKRELQPLYGAFRTVAKDTEDEFRKVYATAAMDFQKMYFPQAYENNAALQRFLGYDPSKVPSGSGMAWMTKKKTAFPTWRDARAAGITPKHPNPIDMFKVYTNNVYDFLSAHRVKEAMVDAGTLRYIKAPEHGRTNIPENWAPLTRGPFTRNAGGVQGYAPKELADVWDTKFSRPIQFKNPKLQTIWEAAEGASNRARAFKFLISGYHGVNMTKEAATRSMGSAIDNLLLGKPVKTMRDLKALLPYSTFQEGRRVRGIYSDLLKGTEREEKIVQAIAQANPSIGRVFGTPELGGSVHESIPQFLDRHGGWQTGEAWGDMRQSVAGQLRGVRDGFIANGPLEMTPYKDAGKAFAEGYDKATDLSSAWLFKHYVPNLKAGMIARDIGDFLDAHPNATNDEIVSFSQRMSGFSDDIMGEYMKDNLFWPKAMHQILEKVFLAPTYLYGTLHAFGKGASGLAQQPGRLLGMADKVPSFNKASPRYEPAMGYTLALIATTAIGNALYQKVKTGIWPEDIWDVMAPRTGGWTEIGSGKHEKRVPERLGPIGNIKEWYDAYKDSGAAGGKAEPLSYLDPKLNPLLTMAIGLGRMKDWRGDPIVNPRLKGAGGAPGDIARYIWSQVEPISVSQGLFQPAQAGTNLSPLERLMGLRPGAQYLSDPEGYRSMMDKKAEDAEKVGERHRKAAEHHAQPRNEDEVP